MLAKTAFSTGVDETLAAVDVYGTDTGADVGSPTSVDLALSDDALAALVGQQVDQSTDLFNSTEDGLQLNSDLLQSSITQCVAGSGSDLSSLDPGILSKVTDTGSGVLSGIQASIGGVTSLLKTVDFKSLTAVGGLIGKLTGGNFAISLTDNAALKTLTGNLMKQACVLGIPGAYTQIAAGITTSGSPISSNTSLLLSATQSTLSTVVSSSNVQMLSEIAQGPVAGSIAATNPGLASSFMGSFSLPKTASTSQITQMGLNTISAFQLLAPSWNKTSSVNNRYGSTTPAPINSSQLLQGATKDFMKMLQVTAAAKPTPYIVKPTSTKVQAIALLPDPTLEFPSGTTSTSQSNADGTSTTVYTLPDETVCTRTLNQTTGQATSAYDYPAQASPPPTPQDTSSVYWGTPEVTSYPVSSSPLSRTTAPPTYPVEPSEFGVESFGAGSYTTQSTRADGAKEQTIHTSSGTTYTKRTLPDGSVERDIVAAPDPTGYTPAQDPFGNLSLSTAADPAKMAVAVDSISNQPAAAQDDPPYMTMGASDALTASFPTTDLW